MRYTGAVLAAALLATPLAAQAQPVQGPYVSAGVGLDLPQNVQATPYPSTPGFIGTHLRMNEHLGLDALGSAGYAIGGGFRFEIEGDYRQNGLNGISRTPFPTSVSGDVHTYGVMVNALYDMDIGLPWLYPYLGAGVGYQWTTLNNVRAAQSGGPFRFGTNETQGALAFQGILGLSFPIPNMPGLSATAEYRFMDITGGERFAGTQVTSAGGAATPVSFELHNQYNHMFLLGVRYAFYTPPPPPLAPATPAAAPAPAVQPARSYLVFFDWDKATLTERARQIIKEAADNSTHVQYTRIAVNGYTDTSGSPQYNKGLSVRRADAVAAELVRDGVPRNAIAIKGFGETHLLVPTGANVREPQNRRVEIIIK
ncbi:MAG TPA: OmpA family protein [Acetobacteraceae bacterium]|nr:OmpA family protein [Acetobacteraceae bacterium]